MTSSDGPLVTTPKGVLRGVAGDGVVTFRGIRYAEAPIGPLRFRAPVPAAAWDGVRSAIATASCAPQPAWRGAGTMSEDCLFLDVYRPDLDGTWPVVVWIHGGAFIYGSSRPYDGSAIARGQRVVVVTINYRLGLLGFAAVDHLGGGAGSANNGIRDQICALQWVRDNIVAFGGDPDNVTLAGESAGGESVAALLASPAADGLYHRAILQSATVDIPALTDRQRGFTDRAIGHLRGSGLASLMEATVDGIVDAQVATATPDVAGPRIATVDVVDIFPSVDGVVVTRTPREAVADRGRAGVPLLIGTNRHEGTVFASMAGTGEFSDERVRAVLSDAGIDAERAFSAYRTFRPGADARQVMTDTITESLVRRDSLGLAEAVVGAGLDAWVSLFTWESPGKRALGAAHGLDLYFLWEWFERRDAERFLGPGPWPRHLTPLLQGIIGHFAHNGTPQHPSLATWPVYEPRRRPTLVLGEEVFVADDPDGATRAVWDDWLPRTRHLEEPAS